MTTMSNNLITQLNWRYATKAFDPSAKISDQKLNIILEALRLAPSSYGLEPWAFIVVKDQELKDRLMAASYGQVQVGQASHVIVLAVRTDINDTFVDNFTSTKEQTEGMPAGTLAAYNGMIKGSINSLTAEQNIQWHKKQAYIALGFAMTACALENVDSCPMEGFDASQFDEILGLKELNLTSAVILPIGIRSAEDKMAMVPKSRRTDVIITK